MYLTEATLRRGGYASKHDSRCVGKTSVTVLKYKMETELKTDYGLFKLHGVSFEKMLLEFNTYSPQNLADILKRVQGTMPFCSPNIKQTAF